jgi:hypothetical protein
MFLKELLLRLNRTLQGQFLREICPFKKMTPKIGRNITAIARKLLRDTQQIKKVKYETARTFAVKREKNPSAGYTPAH